MGALSDGRNVHRDLGWTRGSRRAVPLRLGLASAHTQLLAAILWMGLCRDCNEGKASEVYQPERH